MYNADSQTSTVNIDYYSRVQQMLGGLMPGEVTERKPQDYFGKIPYVPDLQNDILKDTSEFHDNMEPVVERYAGLEKVLVSMYNEVNKALRPSRMSEFSAGQLRSLKSYRAKLDEQLATCREQLSLSQKYLRAEIARAREELKAAEAEEASV
jgi:hypothetical protein